MRRVVLLGAVVLVTAGLPLGSPASSGPSPVAPRPFVIGVDDDHSKWLARPDGLVAKYHDLGLEAVRLTIPWRRGEAKPGRTRVYLHRAAMLIERGQRVVIGVFGRPADAPLDAESRRRYCSYLRHVVQRIPFQDVVIWNEANSPAFWPRGEARAYEALLAEIGRASCRERVL